jgi:hypothetical protein
MSVFCCIPILGIAGVDGKQTFPTAEGRLISKKPVIDGLITAEEWGECFFIKDFKDRVTTLPSLDPTEAYIGYTKESIFIAVICHDRNPANIVGREIIPNSDFTGEDQIEFSINPYGTRSFGQLSEFNVNVLGTKTENIAGGRTGKREWRGEWITATKRSEDGWTCEIEIPWKMLNYPDVGKIDMDMNIVRTQGKSLFEQSWANASQNPLPELQGVWAGIQPPKPPKAKPQFLAYAASELEGGTFRARYGLDARYAFTPAFNGLATVSPDFRNIEDVIAGIDFVRTERFLNETRPFFSEGGGFFRLNGGFNFGNMFYSRRVGPFDFGAKAYGQYKPDLGVGALVTSNFTGQKTAVLNVRKTISATANANVYATLNSDGKENSAVGFTYTNRFTPSVEVNFGAAAEKDSGEKADTAGTFSLSYQRPNIFAIARYNWISPDFEPALGFIPWQDRRGGYVYVSADREFRKGVIRDSSFNLNVDHFLTYDGVIQATGYNVSYGLSTRQDIALSVGKSRYTYSGSLDDTLGFDVTFNASNRFKRFGIGYSSGTQSDLPSSFFALNGEFRAAKNLDLTLSQSVLSLDGTSRQSIATVAYQISAQDLLSSRVAWTDQGTNAYVSYRHAGFAGTEYYLILGDPNARTTQSRISVKLVWAF